MDISSSAASHADQLASFVEGISDELRKQWGSFTGGGQGGFLDPILSFVHAVDWTEPWLIGLIVFHLILLMFVVVSRKQSNTQAALFFSVLSCVYFAERLNSVLQQHWRSFARQPYFDSQGVFLSTVWSGPLLLMSTIILFNSLFTLVSLMVKWKRSELKHRARSARDKTE